MREIDMSGTTGIYILEKFGLSNYDAATLINSGKSFENLVRDVINAPQGFKDPELISAVGKFLNALPDSSMNLFQSIYMLRNFDFSPNEIRTLQNNYNIEYVSDADYKIREIGKLRPLLAEKTKKAISDFKEWLSTDAATLALYEFGLLFQHVDKKISASEVDGQIMAMRYKLGLKGSLFAPTELKNSVSFGLSDVGLGNFNRRFAGVVPTQVQEYVDEKKKVISGGENIRHSSGKLIKQDTKTWPVELRSKVSRGENVASNTGSNTYNEPGLSRLLAYGITENAVSSIGRMGGDFFTVYNMAFSLKPLSGEGLKYEDLDSERRGQYSGVLHKLRTSGESLRLGQFDSIYILNYFGADLDLLQQLDLVGKSRVTDLVSMSGWLRKPPKQLAPQWQKVYKDSIRKPVEMFKEWLKSGAGYNEYEYFLHAITQQRGKDVPVDELLKFVKKVERLGLHIKEPAPIAPVVEETSEMNLIKYHSIVNKDKNVDENSELKAIGVEASSKFLVSDVMDEKRFQSRMRELNYSSPITVKKRFNLREEDGFYFSGEYTSIAKLAEQKLPTYGLFDSYKESWMQLESVRAAIKNLQKNWLIFSIGNGQFVTLERLKDAGVEQSDVANFIESITSSFDVFTIPLALHEGFEHKLVDLGFNNSFLEDILKMSKKVVTITSTIPIFSTDIENRNDFSLLSLVEPFFEKDTQSIDIFDAMNVLSEKYGVIVSEANLRSRVNKSNSFEYSKETERIFKDKKHMINYVYRNN